jgi:hypothetical protein
VTQQLLVTALSGAAAGAVLTGLVTLLTTLLNRRHEHRRWLLDKRLEAYVAFNDELTACVRAMQTGPKGEARRLAASLNALSETITLTAPMRTADLARRLASTALVQAHSEAPLGTRFAHEYAELRAQLHAGQRLDVQRAGLARRAFHRFAAWRFGKELRPEAD